MQLNERVQEFEAMGVNVVAISYDTHIQNSSFSTEHNMQFDVLSDQQAATVKEFGILNEAYEEGHTAFGIPHPGVIFVRPDATIGLKRSVAGYKIRPDLSELLSAVDEVANSS